MTVIFLRKLISIGQQKNTSAETRLWILRRKTTWHEKVSHNGRTATRILQTPILNKQFERARQLFIFCAFTGLARVDMLRLKPKHIHHYDDGTCEIRIKRQKTDVEAIIPLLPIAKEILDTHIKGNNTMIWYFQPWTVRKGIFCLYKHWSDMPNWEGLTFHMARHTFANDHLPFQWYSNGNALQDARTQRYWNDTDLWKNYRPRKSEDRTWIVWQGTFWK